jgi:hypothetical protein
MEYFLKIFPYMVDYKLSQIEIEKAELLSKTKYRTWEWNYAYGPEYTFNNSFQMNGENHSCNLFVKEGIILESIIKKSNKIIPVGKKLTGCRHMVSDILSVLNQEKIDISKEDIFNFF